MRHALVVVFVALLALGAGSSAQPVGAQEQVKSPAAVAAAMLFHGDRSSETDSAFGWRM